MNDTSDLSGYQILVVEDEYFIAADMTRELQGAGAHVVGPCPTEESARAALAKSRPDAALVDINLGRGPSFKLAEALRDRGIPFLFLTGYDRDGIPVEYIDVRRIEKPCQLHQVVGAISQLLNTSLREKSSDITTGS
ncbi:MULTISPECIES: response regulator [unclassified Bosea (in: a-proteobacteria)]|uniref:response regulator n=1 Tax=unclassified Bosea (in: a-proteobacteria) TaxID=2653178 RepID=UPI001EFFBF09|nr:MULTISPECIES: response regulator [unclassified Bosea (in: a-proteobacteria)]